MFMQTPKETYLFLKYTKHANRFYQNWTFVHLCRLSIAHAEALWNRKEQQLQYFQGVLKKLRIVEEKSSSLFHVHNVNCSANGLRDILDGSVLPWMSFMHCSPHQSKVKGNFYKVYSVNCFGQTGKRLKPANDYNWQHWRGRFLKNPKLNTIILLPCLDAQSSRVCSIINLFSVKYRL